MTDEALTAAAHRFIDAIVWGEHVTVWELLSPIGRERVLEAGSRKGLDPLQAARIREGTSPQNELDRFLTGLVHGLRIDFAAVPISEVRADSTATMLADGSVQVALFCPANFGEGRWSAGTLVMSNHDNVWLVDRLNPVVSRSE